MILIQDNMTIKWKNDGNRYCLHIQQDNQPDNPRRDFDQISTMACWSSRYTLGDDIGKMNPEEFWQDLVRKNVPESDVNEAAIAGKISSVRIKKDKENPNLYDVHLEDWGMDYEGLRKETIVYYVLEELSVAECQSLLHPYAEWLPLWLYDHSGITMSCGTRTYPYSGLWDSGQIGYIIVLKDKIVSELSLDPNEEEDWRRRAVTIMESDVELYDKYLTGEVYHFCVYKFLDNGSGNGDWVEIDSCGGFYGDDLTKNGMLESTGYNIQYAIEAEQYTVGEAQRQVHVCWSFD